MKRTYLFMLKKDTRIIGNFIQASIAITPESLNDTPINIAIADIQTIQRVDDTQWAPPKLKYFTFEMRDNTTITGKPLDRTCLIESAIFKQCKVEFDNMLKVEKLG